MVVTAGDPAGIRPVPGSSQGISSTFLGLHITYHGTIKSISAEEQFFLVVTRLQSGGTIQSRNHQKAYFMFFVTREKLHLSRPSGSHDSLTCLARPNY